MINPSTWMKEIQAEKEVREKAYQENIGELIARFEEAHRCGQPLVIGAYDVVRDDTDRGPVWVFAMPDGTVGAKRAGDCGNPLPALVFEEPGPPID